MPLVSIREELAKAQAGRYALPCFLAFEPNGADGIFAALAERNCPAMVGVYTAMLDNPKVSALVAYLATLARQSPVNISLMLDHGASVDHCRRALALGLTDVMYDGSKLPLAENIANARQVAELAHAAGGCLEAEIGVVGDGGKYQEFGAVGKGFTDPAAAERFYDQTRCDVLAVAIGNAHGVYRGQPRLDLELLAEIRRRVPVPLSLHGGTGLSAEQFRAAIAGGICKVNIFTDLALAVADRLAERPPGERPTYFALTKTIREAFRQRCLHHIDIFRPEEMGGQRPSPYPLPEGEG